MLSLYFPTEEKLVEFANRLAPLCPNTFIIFLYGNLGAGKTTFVRGFLRGLEYEGFVKSPTYSLVESYEFEKLTVFHFDFYRIASGQELEHFGIQDYFVPHAISLVEWPENGMGLLPKPDLSCYIDIHLTGRELKIDAQSQSAKELLTRLQHDN